MAVEGQVFKKVSCDIKLWILGESESEMKIRFDTFSSGWTPPPPVPYLAHFRFIGDKGVVQFCGEHA